MVKIYINDAVLIVHENVNEISRHLMHARKF